MQNDDSVEEWLLVATMVKYSLALIIQKYLTTHNATNDQSGSSIRESRVVSSYICLTIMVVRPSKHFGILLE